MTDQKNEKDVKQKMNAGFYEDPICIIGIGCRFPGKSYSPNEFWENLKNRMDGIVEVPQDRWNPDAYFESNKNAPGMSYVKWGGFVDGIDLFDPHFFGISPREAACIDPQHRMLLEVTWEGLEDAGIRPESLAGSATGVFLGQFMHDYEIMLMNDRQMIGPHTSTGTSMCITANRISYLFDLNGPSFTLDTACSSSMIAIHLACQSLKNGESELAIAGGVNIILKPELTISECKATMLSPDGRSKSFDSRANGYVRGEGAGVLILKPLSKALEDGDTIYAMIRGTGTNQDGRTKGITVPNGEAQKALIRSIHAQCGVEAKDIQYMEAHGTGTFVGDPIEANALGDVVGQNREEPCLIGSVKSNIGHLESAAGVAGVIKVALALKHKTIPPNIHFHKPNPNIDFTHNKIKVVTEPTPWQENKGMPRLAGVNSFGFGGSNAHALLEEAPQSLSRTKEQDQHAGTQLLLLSARSEAALKMVAENTAALLRNPNVDPKDVCYSSNCHKGFHDLRLALVGGNREELLEALDAFDKGESRLGMSQDRVQQGGPKGISFVFSGMGPEWFAMGRELMASEPLYRRYMETCDALFQKLGGWSLLDILSAETEEASQIKETIYAQPANFSMQVALYHLWESWGIKPEVIVGHSVGEAAAAYAAGALSLEDAATVIFHRSRLQHKTAGMGKMLAAGLSLQETEQVLKGMEDKVSVAAINSPTSVTLAGDETCLTQIEAELQLKGTFARFLKVEVPYHSPAMDPLMDELISSLAAIRPQKVHTPLYSTVTGELAEGTEVDGAYWAKNIRYPVYFHKALTDMVEKGNRVFLELAAHPVLAASINETLESMGVEGVSIPSVLRKKPEAQVMKGSFGRLFSLGLPVAPAKLFPQGGNFIKLPAYPWDRASHWHESAAARKARIGTPAHPILGIRRDAHEDVWTNVVDSGRHYYLYDHGIQDTLVFPGTGYIEIALSAAREIWGEVPVGFRNIQFQKAMFLNKEHPSEIKMMLDRSGSHFQIASRPQGEEREWDHHTMGEINRLHEIQPPHFDLAELKAKLNPSSKQDCYKKFNAMGFEYGPFFQGIGDAWVGHMEALAELAFTPDVTERFDQFFIHPIVLDNCAQVLLASVSINGNYMPYTVERARIYRRLPADGKFWGYAKLHEESIHHFLGDIFLIDEHGEVIVEIRDFYCKGLGYSKNQGKQKLDNSVYGHHWRIKPQPGLERRFRSADFLQTCDQIEPVVRYKALRMAEQYGIPEFYKKIRQKLDDLCLHFYCQALHRMGWSFPAETKVSLQEIHEKLNIQARHRDLVNLMMSALVDQGILSPTATRETWLVQSGLPQQDPLVRWQELIAAYPTYQSLLILVGRCGLNLPDLLQADEPPTAQLFTNETTTGLRNLFEHTPNFRIYHSLIQKVCLASLEGKPAHRRVRILEVGDREESLDTHLLPALSKNTTDYFLGVKEVTDHVKEKHEHFPFLDVLPFDLAQDLDEQDIPKKSFHIILVSNLQRFGDQLPTVLGRLHALLAPGGMLVFLEPAQSGYWLELLHHLDEKQGEFHPSKLSWTEWESKLEEAGFVNVRRVNGAEDSEMGMENVIFANIPMQQAENEKINAMVPNLKEEGQWLIFSDEQGLGQHLAERLRAAGQIPVMVEPGKSFSGSGSHFVVRPEVEGDMVTLVNKLHGQGSKLSGMVHLWSLRDQEQEPSIATMDRTQELGCENIIALLKAFEGKAKSQVPQLWMVTRGAQNVGEMSGLNLGQCALWGLGRVILNEHPEFKSRLIDLSPETSRNEDILLFNELFADDAEDEVAFRNDHRYVHRLQRTEVDPWYLNADQDTYGDDTPSFRLESKGPGDLDHIVARSAPIAQPGENQVLIQIQSLGLNFDKQTKETVLLNDSSTRDMPNQGEEPYWEVAGKVVAVGKNVHRFRTGDEVMGLTEKGLRSHVLADQNFLAHKPAGMPFDQAATLPYGFFTAYYSLCELARIRRGDRVLICAAAGNIGLAAVQVALKEGAEVFATAATAEKRDVLNLMGVKHVFDSHAPTFTDEVMQRTEHRGFDTIFNPGDNRHIDQCWGILAPHGRLIQMANTYEDHGKRRQLPPVPGKFSYHAVDINGMLRERPEFAADMFNASMAGFSIKGFRPLPCQVFPISESGFAFRILAKERHVGQIVFSYCNQTIKVEGKPEEAYMPKANGTYLVTGGLTGFGLATAEWLVNRGARHLVLVSRRGIANDTARETVTRFEQMGVTVRAPQVDVSNEEQVAGMMAEIAERMPPLRGIIHSANVYDDAIIQQMDKNRWHRVLRPKAYGAWLLHTYAQNQDLDFFVSYSSISAIIGNPVQGNYAAANTFLDCLAQHRALRGQAGLSVNWGAVGDVGYVAEDDERGKYLKRIGVDLIPSKGSLDLMGRIIRLERSQAMIAIVDWRRWAEIHQGGSVQRFSHLIKSGNRSASNAGKGDAESNTVRNAVLCAEGEERLQIMHDFLRSQVAQVLLSSADRIQLDEPLIYMGLDSLIAVELSNRIKNNLEVDILPVKLIQGPSILDLGQIIEEQLFSREMDEEEETAPQAEAMPLETTESEESDRMSQLLENMDDLSESDVDRLLGAMMEGE